MFESPVSKTTLVLSALFSLVIVLSIFFNSSLKTQTTVVFCDVGQGDGAYIRLKNKFDILIDAGPDRKILDCLGKYMPFYDKSIELVILSHQQKDHYGGFLYLLDRYELKKIWMTPVYKPNQSINELINKFITKKIPIEHPTAGQRTRYSVSLMEFLWPSEKFINQHSWSNNSQFKFMKETNEDLNQFSLVLSIEIKDIKILFTGDATSTTLNRLMYQSKLRTTILKIPHHGSKNGLTPNFLKLADPTYGVISAGKNNAYGHPSKEALDMLEARKVKVRRTDLEGDIVFKIK